MKALIYWLFTPPVTGSSNILIIRLMTATVFCWESILRFIQENGTPFAGTPSVSTPFAGIPFVSIGVILGSILLFLGLLTRFTALLLIILTVLLTTRIPQNPMCTCTELLSCIFLLLEGPGRRSLDFFIATSGKIYRIP